MNFRGYVLGVLIATGAVLALVGGFNWLVDPYWYFGGPVIDGFNAVKTQADRLERYAKPRMLAQDRPEVIVLGSSTSEMGFDPRSGALTDAGRLRAFNFAFAGGLWGRTQCAFEFALAHAPVKRVVLGFDPGPAPLADCAQDFPEAGADSLIAMLFSLRTLRASWLTVSQQPRGRPTLSREGLYYGARGEPGVAQRFANFFTQIGVPLYRERRCRLEGLGGRSPEAAPLPPELPTPPSRMDLEGLRRLIRLAAARDIEIRIYAYPMHAYWLEVDIRCDLQPERWAALGAVARLLQEEKGRVSMWGFYGYNRYTTEPATDFQPRFWQEPLHFNYELGDLILDEMRRAGPHGLGFEVTPETLPAAYNAFRDGRERHLASHPGFLKEVAPFAAILRPAQRD